MENSGKLISTICIDETSTDQLLSIIAAEGHSDIMNSPTTDMHNVNANSAGQTINSIQRN